MGIAGTVIKKVLPAAVTLIGGLALFKGKSGAQEYDPDQPTARDGAIRPGVPGRSSEQIATHKCEALIEGTCNSTDVADWVATYYEKGIEPMMRAAHSLKTVAPDDDKAQYLISQALGFQNQFRAEYPGMPPIPDNVYSAEGHEYEKIRQINSQIDTVITLRKEMVAAYAKAAPGKVPDGLQAEDKGILDKGNETNVGAYAAAGTVMGLGIALAFVVASNSKRKKLPAA